MGSGQRIDVIGAVAQDAVRRGLVEPYHVIFRSAPPVEKPIQSLAVRNGAGAGQTQDGQLRICCHSVLRNNDLLVLVPPDDAIGGIVANVAEDIGILRSREDGVLSGAALPRRVDE